MTRFDKIEFYWPRERFTALSEGCEPFSLVFYVVKLKIQVNVQSQTVKTSQNQAKQSPIKNTQIKPVCTKTPMYLLKLGHLDTLSTKYLPIVSVEFVIYILLTATIFPFLGRPCCPGPARLTEEMWPWCRVEYFPGKWNVDWLGIKKFWEENSFKYWGEILQYRFLAEPIEES